MRASDVNSVTIYRLLLAVWIQNISTTHIKQFFLYFFSLADVFTCPTVEKYFISESQSRCQQLLWSRLLTNLFNLPHQTTTSSRMHAGYKVAYFHSYIVQAVKNMWWWMWMPDVPTRDSYQDGSSVHAVLGHREDVTVTSFYIHIRITNMLQGWQLKYYIFFRHCLSQWISAITHEEHDVWIWPQVLVRSIRKMTF